VKRVESRQIIDTAPQIDPGVQGQKGRDAVGLASFQNYRNHRKSTIGFLLVRLPDQCELHLALLYGTQPCLADEDGDCAHPAQNGFEFIEPWLAWSQIGPVEERTDISQKESLPDL
jgi:hypothetical protein